MSNCSHPQYRLCRSNSVSQLYCLPSLEQFATQEDRQAPYTHNRLKAIWDILKQLRIIITKMHISSWSKVSPCYTTAKSTWDYGPGTKELDIGCRNQKLHVYTNGIFIVTFILRKCMHKLRKIEKDISLLDMQQDKTIPISPWKISHISFSFICITSENKSKPP
jgi:hypothetical protein